MSRAAVYHLRSMSIRFSTTENQMGGWQPRDQVDDNAHAEMEPCKRMNIERSDGDGESKAVVVPIC